MQKFSKNVQTVINILQDEVNGDIHSALEKMSNDYTMTWVDLGHEGNQLFRHTQNEIKKDMETAYPIKGRQYDIRNIAESENLVIVELIESYPDQKTGIEYRTPLILVLEMEDGKIRTGRHYLDPRLSGKQLSREEIEKAYQNSKGSILVIK